MLLHRLPAAAWPQHRTSVLKHIETTPDAMWKTKLPFNFKNQSKTYGSPMFDAVRTLGR